MSRDNLDDKLLDHEYDGIRELDNDLPRWWLYGFYLTVVFSLVYMLYYHGTDDGLLMEEEYQQEVSEAAALYGTDEERESDPLARLASMDLTLLEDEANMQAGREIFNSTKGLCYTCHREDGGGQVGPNLTDAYWLHGCDMESIVANIITGFPERGMVPYGSGQKLTDKELLQVSSYILSMQGSNPADPKPADMERATLCE